MKNKIKIDALKTALELVQYHLEIANKNLQTAKEIAESIEEEETSELAII